MRSLKEVSWPVSFRVLRSTIEWTHTVAPVLIGHHIKVDLVEICRRHSLDGTLLKAFEADSLLRVGQYTREIEILRQFRSAILLRLHQESHRFLWAQLCNRLGLLSLTAVYLNRVENTFICSLLGGRMNNRVLKFPIIIGPML